LALESANHQTAVESSNQKVILCLPPLVKLDFGLFPDLDPAKPDHQIVVEYAALIQAEPRLKVLTDDTLLAWTLKSVGFDHQLIPASWKLQPEKDERDDKIDSLQAELKSYKNNTPVLALRTLDREGAEASAFVEVITVFDRSSAEINEAANYVRQRSPMITAFGRPRGTSSIPWLEPWQPPSESDVREYIHVKYPTWSDSLPDELSKLVPKLNEITHEITFTAEITNSGFVNATGVRLTLSSFDGFTLLPELDETSRKDRAASIAISEAPSPPQGRSITDMVNFASLRFSDELPRPADYLRPRDIDPNSFYYSSSRPRKASSELELNCPAFPHKGDPYPLAFRLVVPDAEPSRKSRLKIRLEASNLREPLERYIGISVTFKRMDFRKEVIRLANPGKWVE
jgi:hypothetical protein